MGLTLFLREVGISGMSKSETKLDISTPSTILRLKVAWPEPLAQTWTTSSRLLRMKASSVRLKLVILVVVWWFGQSFCWFKMLENHEAFSSELAVSFQNGRQRMRRPICSADGLSHVTTEYFVTGNFSTSSHVRRKHIKLSKSLGPHRYPYGRFLPTTTFICSYVCLKGYLVMLSFLDD